jgi:predicted RNA-binding protein YlxR (DUF448 family)
MNGLRERPFIHNSKVERSILCTIPIVQSLFCPYGDKGAITNSVNTHSLASTAIKNHSWISCKKQKPRQSKQAAANVTTTKQDHHGRSTYLAASNCCVRSTTYRQSFRNRLRSNHLLYACSRSQNKTSKTSSQNPSCDVNI